MVGDATEPKPFINAVDAFNTYPNDWRYLWSYDGECTVTRAMVQPNIMMRTSGAGGSPSDIQFVNFSAQPVRPYSVVYDPVQGC